METVLKTGAQAMGIPLGDREVAAFIKYREFLEEKNREMNLTAITGCQEVAQRHFLDSLALLQAADFAGAHVIDVGSGAGLPGIPLRIARPDVRLTLLDSQRKRVTFLRALSDLISCPDVACIHGRAEEVGRLPAYREQFDIAVSRAVARLNLLAELCLPFVKVGGRFLAMKSLESDEEIAEAGSAVKILGGELLPSRIYTIPGTDMTHRLVIVEKRAPTPAIYPRRFPKIQKAPL